MSCILNRNNDRFLCWALSVLKSVLGCLCRGSYPIYSLPPVSVFFWAIFRPCIFLGWTPSPFWIPLLKSKASTGDWPNGIRCARNILVGGIAVNMGEHLKVNCISWVVPPPSNSHHQDYEPFLVGNPYKPSFPLLLGGGTTQCTSHDLTMDFLGSNFLELGMMYLMMYFPRHGKLKSTRILKITGQTYTL